MKGQPRVLACRVFLTCLLVGTLHACRSGAPPAPAGNNMERPRPPSAAPTDRPRTDGIYECRTETPTSSGGWPFFHPPSRPAQIAYFLRFYPDGQVHYICHRDPITTADAVKSLEGLDGTEFSTRQPYVRDGDQVRFTIGDTRLVYWEGTLGRDQLTLRWWSEGAPPEVDVFRFVKWP